jgi:hypothetical protein
MSEGDAQSEQDDEDAYAVEGPALVVQVLDEAIVEVAHFGKGRLKGTGERDTKKTACCNERRADSQDLPSRHERE